jgi:hypothetical protein
MIIGAMLIAGATVSAAESASSVRAVRRECDRYGLEFDRTLSASSGADPDSRVERRRWWDLAIVAAALGVFAWFGVRARVPQLEMRAPFAIALVIILLAVLGGCGWILWKNTRFA